MPLLSRTVAVFAAHEKVAGVVVVTGWHGVVVVVVVDRWLAGGASAKEERGALSAAARSRLLPLAGPAFSTPIPTYYTGHDATQ